MPNQHPYPSQRSGCLSIFLIILGIYQILFASRVLLHIGFNSDSWTFVSLVQVIIAGIWAILFTHALIRMGKRQANALRYSGWLIIGFVFSRLLQTALFVQADYDRNRLGFLLVVTLVILVVPILLLIQQRENSTQN